MSVFTYDAYVKESENRKQNGGNFPKIGFFKLAKDGDACLVRFNVHSQADLKLVKVHKPVFGKKFEGLSNPYAGISCFNDVTQHSAETCPLCQAAANGHPVINKAENVIFVQMIVSYKDPTTGAFSEPVPVVWERKAAYARELAAKLTTYGDLTNQLFLMTRIGSGKETKYNLDYAVPTIFKPEMVPADFSAFENFQVNRHSYWEKSPEEINTYLMTGTFPEVAKEEGTSQTATAQPAYAAPVQPTVQPSYAGGYVAPTATPAQPAYQAPVSPAYQAPATPVYNTPATPAQPAQPAGQAPAEERPARQFGGRF